MRPSEILFFYYLKSAMFISIEMTGIFDLIIFYIILSVFTASSEIVHYIGFAICFVLYLFLLMIWKFYVMFLVLPVANLIIKILHPLFI